MKKLLPLCLLALCSVAMMGCPYESHVPIDGGEPVDKRFVGNWSSEDETYNKYTVSPKSATEYSILQKTVTGSTAKFTGSLCDVKGATFMNLYSDSTKTYYIYRIKFDPTGTKFTLMPVVESLNQHFSSSVALRSFVEKNLNLQSFYNNDDKEEFYKSE